MFHRGPFFLVYINDIVVDIGSSIRLFADNTSLYIIVDDPVTAAGSLNTDLQRITRWAAIWLVSFNPTKTEVFLASRKLNRNHPPIYMQNQQITEVEAHKHLGIYFSIVRSLSYLTDRTLPPFSYVFWG